jgi:FkbM family methyltransferase
MLIHLDKILFHLKEHNIQIKGVLHLGAHDCEEIVIYDKMGIDHKNIVWIDGFIPKVLEAKNKGFINVYYAVISDTDNQDVTFNVSNNIQSSSILELGTHSYYHSNIVYINKIPSKTTTVDTFFKKNELNASKYNFWNMDIQGAEMLALKGGLESLQYVDAIYLEVNTTELYRGCSLFNDIDAFLVSHGFTLAEVEITDSTWGDALYIKI